MTPALPVLTAVTGRWESALVSELEGGATGVVVVRRCADLADLLATAVTGQARAVVVSADLRRLDAEALSRLALATVAVVALVEPGDEAAERRLRQLGVGQVLAADAGAEQVSQAVTAAVDELTARAPDTQGTAYGDPRAAMARARRLEGPETPSGGSGQVVAVWGPAGSPGRTTVAVGLAAELARAGLGASTLLVDADTYAASVAQVLGLLDEAPGLASAARAADHGTLDLLQLSRLAPQVSDGLRVLTGIASAQRWPELRPASLSTVLGLARSLVSWTVVDTSSCLEQDEELSYDTAAPRRNGATLAVLQDADLVVAVGSADPVGLHRLVRGLQDLAAVTDARTLVLVNRVRSAAVGARPDDKVRAALERYAGVTDAVLVPDDPASLDAAVLQGRLLAEVAVSSPARLALVHLADTVAGRAAGRERVRGGGWLRRMVR